MAVFLVATLLALPVQASITPTAPGPGEIYPIGGVCPIKWKPSAIADPAWSTFTIGGYSLKVQNSDIFYDDYHLMILL